MNNREVIEKLEDAYRRVRKIGPDAIYETELREVLRAAADALAAVPDAATDWQKIAVEQTRLERGRAEQAEAERDAALAAVERVQETLSLHNPNGRLVKEVLAALDGAPEPEVKP